MASGVYTHTHAHTHTHTFAYQSDFKKPGRRTAGSKTNPFKNFLLYGSRKSLYESLYACTLLTNVVKNSENIIMGVSSSIVKLTGLTSFQK